MLGSSARDQAVMGKVLPFGNRVATVTGGTRPSIRMARRMTGQAAPCGVARHGLFGATSCKKERQRDQKGETSRQSDLRKKRPIAVNATRPKQTRRTNTASGRWAR